MANAPTITIEIAFTTNPLDDTPSWTDVSAYVNSIPLIRRGRQHELNQIEAGEATVILNNLDRRFDPTNVASPYYPNVVPMRKIRISATWSSTTYRLFTGFIESWPPEWPIDGTATVSIRCVDGFKIFNLAKISLSLSAQFGQGQIGAVLDAVGWPAADRALANFQTFMAAATLSASPALQRLQDIVTAENGLLFIRGDGFVNSQNRFYRLTTSTSMTSQATFGDAGVELPYTELTPSYDDSQIWNEVQVTAAGGATQTASDATSQAAYAKRTLTKSGLIIGDASGLGGTTADVEAAGAAAWLLANYKDPALRFTSMTLAGITTPSTLWPHILGRDISDRITAKKRPPGGGAAIATDCFIEAIEHHIPRNPEDWTTTWQLSPASSLTYWILDSTTLSVLDSTTRLGY